MTYHLKFTLSWLALFYERAWSAYWPAFTATFAYAGITLMNIPAAFGTHTQTALLALTAAAILYTLGRPFRFPTAQDTARRMERAAALSHRPLAALHDTPAGTPNDDAQALWQLHRARMATLKDKIKIVRPRPDVAKQDRYALRHAALILLVIGFVLAGTDAQRRLENGFSPAINLDLHIKTAATDVWITPPDYTNQPPLFLAAARDGITTVGNHITVPAGSILKVRVEGISRAPRLRYGGTAIPVPRASAKSFIAAVPLATSGRLVLRQGVRDLGIWHINITPDAAPQIKIISAEQTKNAALKITYAAVDDYGLSTLTGSIAPPTPLPPEQGGQITTFEMTPPANGGGQASYTIDVTAHLRAGQEALLTLSATDGAGNVATSEAFTFTLPARAFANPLAQKLIAARKSLMDAQDPISRKAIADNIAEAGQNPAAYKGDTTIFMALGSAVRRIIYDDSVEATLSVQDLLWDISIKLEDGGLSVAARDLAEVLDEMTRALADKNTSKEQLAELMDEARAKMQAYLQSLVAEMARKLQQESGRKSAQIPPEIAKKFMKSIDLGDMLRQMQQMSESGARGDMQKMAEALKNAMRGVSLGDEEIDEKQLESMKALEDLQDLINDQQSLLDKTSRVAEDAEGKAEAKKLEKAQENLRHKLGDIAKKLGENMKDVPPNLAKADQSMKQSQKSLGESKPREAVPPQKTALDEMQKGMDNAITQLAQTMQQMVLSLGFAPDGQQNIGEGFDPLGRGDDSDRGKGGDFQVPDSTERRRIQQIIEELRNRSNEYERPKIERDYLDRLLDRTN